MSLQLRALGRRESKVDGGHTRGVPHVGDFCARLEGVLVERAGIEDKGDALAGMEQDDRAGGPTIIAQELYGCAVVCVICEVEADFVRVLS